MDLDETRVQGQRIKAKLDNIIAEPGNNQKMLSLSDHQPANSRVMKIFRQTIGKIEDIPHKVGEYNLLENISGSHNRQLQQKTLMLYNEKRKKGNSISGGTYYRIKNIKYNETIN
ncbi:hypothetical protein POVCU1_058320 [Plasmodium ovale curtisi]|uniref:Uncharacterized protein n=1 Tax=Plasmodium ovale curtisi TaxID=864141 RepID=A0A1A8X7J0_PLAOA|nr:hypothetical protein POVCU1_058320 [Plasmodium ovale curtisi]